MNQPLVHLITSSNSIERNTSIASAASKFSTLELLEQCRALDEFRRSSTNLYERVRALFFLYAIHRFMLPQRREAHRQGLIPYEGYAHLLSRRFEEAIDLFLRELDTSGPSDAVCSALAAAYKDLGFATLASQVRRSVRSVRGNQWMFRVGHSDDHPLRVRPELLQRNAESGLYPILAEKTPVRMDLSHSGWSDIFFF